VDVEGGLINLASSREGLITQVRVEEGAQVAKGQVLATLDDRPARLALTLADREFGQAQAQGPALELRLAAARREEARLELLVPKDGASAQELEQARDARRLAQAERQLHEAVLASARTRVAQARYEVEQRIVRAPLAGQIVRRMARPGDGVSTLNVTPLFQFAPDLPRIVRAELDEAYVHRVEVGQAAQITLDADERRTVPGRVLRLGRVVGVRQVTPDPNERTDTRVVECVLSLEPNDFLIGQRVLVRFRSREGARP
jgi:RND family efflux transporter MFP subunit